MNGHANDNDGASDVSDDVVEGMVGLVENEDEPVANNAWGNAVTLGWGPDYGLMPQEVGAWQDPDAPPSLTSRLVDSEATLAARQQLAVELGAKFEELVAEVFLDPVGFIALLFNNPIVLGGQSLERLLQWRNFLMQPEGQWQLDPDCCVELFAPLSTFNVIHAELTSAGQGWERVEEPYFSPTASYHYHFISAGNCTRRWIYTRQANGVDMSVVIANLGPCVSNLPFASFDWCCGMRICRIVWPMQGNLAFAGDQIIQQTQPHFLHEMAGVMVVGNMMDVEVRLEQDYGTVLYMRDGIDRSQKAASSKEEERRKLTRWKAESRKHKEIATIGQDTRAGHEKKVKPGSKEKTITVDQILPRPDKRRLHRCAIRLGFLRDQRLDFGDGYEHFFECRCCWILQE
ncbi:hypothetical protein SISSUDRAFT_1038482 [Sistotremastrum suecicum HHB10207 ss-3]|uniref:Uncharacterized protein n=1 Tax=Sistotremastrum suecicum HHB10207 ss-3 TaxID=1314776 RepID=A0A165WNU6_9AGAM|nr:hypothetical protein SISSUDRAFT_1038482 [Sistotremastrum suecicum HHB10207 ss-3]